MAEPTALLQHHKLVHLGPLRLQDGLFRARFPKVCSTSRCTGKCCLSGVWTDLGDKDVILARAESIRGLMDADQEQDPEKWFGETCDDADFPSRRAVSTAVVNGACVFLNRARRCVLQIASERMAEPRIDLKPFFCTAFPITIDAGQLEIGEEYDPACCTPAAGATLDVFDLCSKELEFVLGAAGVEQLRQIAGAQSHASHGGDHVDGVS